MPAAQLVPLPGQPIPSVFSFTYNPTLTPLVCTPPLFGDISVPLFGGALANLPLIPRTPDPVELLGRGLQQIGVQFAPMAPALTLMQALKAVVDFVVGLPGNVAQAIAFNPSPLIQSVQKVVGASARLIELAILPLQMARMIRQSLTVLIQYLTALKLQIDQLVTRYTNLEALRQAALAAGNAAWMANIVCARERLDAKVAAMNAALAALGVAIALLSIILCFVTGGHLDPLPALNPSALTSAVFDPVIAALTVIRDAIPDLSGLALEC